MRVETLVNRSGCQIIVANQSNLSPQQELVEDLLAIIHCFSCRIYGSRHYAKEKVKAAITRVGDWRYEISNLAKLRVIL
ncbi:MAG: hypothetical protein F6K23_13835 [Okeania sp. SIO2C9]|nr:hypothetical protein [Okeania sp. SIO2C9]